MVRREGGEERERARVTAAETTTSAPASQLAWPARARALPASALTPLVGPCSGLSRSTAPRSAHRCNVWGSLGFLGLWSRSASSPTNHSRPLRLSPLSLPLFPLSSRPAYASHGQLALARPACAACTRPPVAAPVRQTLLLHPLVAEDRAGSTEESARAVRWHALGPKPPSPRALFCRQSAPFFRSHFRESELVVLAQLVLPLSRAEHGLCATVDATAFLARLARRHSGALSKASAPALASLSIDDAVETFRQRSRVVSERKTCATPRLCVHSSAATSTGRVRPTHVSLSIPSRPTQTVRCLTLARRSPAACKRDGVLLHRDESARRRLLPSVAVLPSHYSMTKTLHTTFPCVC